VFLEKKDGAWDTGTYAARGKMGLALKFLTFTICASKIISNLQGFHFHAFHPRKEIEVCPSFFNGLLGI
jgi:hypothetical protein